MVHSIYIIHEHIVMKAVGPTVNVTTCFFISGIMLYQLKSDQSNSDIVRMREDRSSTGHSHHGRMLAEWSSLYGTFLSCRGETLLIRSKACTCPIVYHMVTPLGLSFRRGSRSHW